jgi:hypothetical protein
MIDSLIRERIYIYLKATAKPCQAKAYSTITVLSSINLLAYCGKPVIHDHHIAKRKADSNPKQNKPTFHKHHSLAAEHHVHISWTSRPFIGLVLRYETRHASRSKESKIKDGGAIEQGV